VVGAEPAEDRHEAAAGQGRHGAVGAVDPQLDPGGAGGLGVGVEVRVGDPGQRGGPGGRRRGVHRWREGLVAADAADEHADTEGDDDCGGDGERGVEQPAAPDGRGAVAHSVEVDDGRRGFGVAAQRRADRVVEIVGHDIAPDTSVPASCSRRVVMPREAWARTAEALIPRISAIWASDWSS